MRKPPEEFVCRRDEVGELALKPLHRMSAEEIEAALRYQDNVAYRLSLAASHEPDNTEIAARALEAEQKYGRLVEATRKGKFGERGDPPRPRK